VRFVAPKIQNTKVTEILRVLRVEGLGSTETTEIPPH
jgi:hypothetical protein